MTSPLSPNPTIVETGAAISLDASAWSASMLTQLASAGEDGVNAVNFIKSRNIKIGFSKQNATGAKWSLDGNIYLNANSYSLSTPPTDAFMLNLVAHEALHLRQRMITALSVYGELEAWQLGFRVYKAMGGPISSSVLNELMSLPLSYDRELLQKVRFLMQDYAGKGYRIDLLPRYPLWKEIVFDITRKVPG
jgi:hypothetical protein